MKRINYGFLLVLFFLFSFGSFELFGIVHVAQIVFGGL